MGGVLVASLLMAACGSDEGGRAAVDPTSAARTTSASTAPRPTPSTTTATTSGPITATPITTSAPARSPGSVAATATTLIDDPLPTATAPGGPSSAIANAGPTSTTVALPVPIAVPLDSAGDEPVIADGTIQIPKLGIDMTMYEGIRLTTLDRGPGHWPGTALPGQVGNVVVAGHRVSHSKPFRNVDKLVAGDQVIFNTSNGRFVYTVVSQEIVLPDALNIVDQTSAKTATLFACHPPGSTTQRIVVHLVYASDQRA